MSTRKGGRPTVPDHLKRTKRIDVMVNPTECAALDAASDGRPRATLVREWALSVARDEVTALPGPVQTAVDEAAMRAGISRAEWVALACLARLESTS